MESRFDLLIVLLDILVAEKDNLAGENEKRWRKWTYRNDSVAGLS